MHASSAERSGKPITAWSTAAKDSMVGPGGKRGWLHVFTAGEWKGHPTGPFDLTGATFDQMIANFERQKTPLSIDYDHSLPERGDSRAAGWIRKLEKRIGNDGPELWAEVEWTPTAARMIVDGEYKNCSGYFSLESTDRVTGESIGAELFNVGLTNNPFIDGLTPIQLSRESRRDAVAASAIRDASKTLAAPPPPKKPEGEEEEEGEDGPPAEGAPPEPADAPPTDPAAQPAPPPPGQSPEGDQQALLAQTLTAAIDQMCKVAGLDRVSVVEMLPHLADEMGGRMREMKERDQTPAEERQMSKTETTPQADDAAQLAAAKVEAANNTVALMAAELKGLKERLDARDAKEKADKEAANDKRIALMLERGALKETEKKTATWMLNNHPAEFEEVYGGREGLGKPVPIGEMQSRQTVAAARVDDDGVKVPAEVQEDERHYYLLCKSMGLSDERALARTIKQRTKHASRRAAKVG